ncbi:hypothetical protein GCM10010340_47750 [Streptomyces griseoloalbus]|nr:hypothetical protein GCM10010340_47750 [Streptomyces albaduncus]
MRGHLTAELQAEVDQRPCTRREDGPAPDEPRVRRGGCSGGVRVGPGVEGQALQLAVGSQEGVAPPGQFGGNGTLPALDLAQVPLVVVERCGELGESQPRFLS